MAKTNFQTIDEYVATLPETTRSVLQQVRAAIRKALPEAEEGISYQIPAFKAGGKAVLFFAGWKAHYSIYPASAAMVEAFSDELAGLEISKGTIRFPLDKPVPVKLIAKLATFRGQETAARVQAKRAAAKRH